MFSFNEFLAEKESIKAFEISSTVLVYTMNFPESLNTIKLKF